MRANTFLFIFFLSGSLALYGQSWEDTTARLHKILSRYEASGPGVQLAISRNGQLLYTAARGMADLEHNVPLTAATKIEAGSVSKQFTAAAILLLQQQGKLSVNDDVRKYLPGLPNYGPTITLRHLMNHTSGLKDWGSIAWLTGWPRGQKAFTNNDALEIISRQKTLNNQPGDEYIYSNSGYTLLTHIVERVSGQSLAAFTRQHIFEPAGMRQTEWRENFTKVVPGRAIAYRHSEGGYLMEMPFEDTHGHGGLLTTAEDLLRWNQFYLSGKFGTASLFTAQTAHVPLRNGKQNPYAAGLVINTLHGMLQIAHSGATAGYRANLEAYPGKGLSIALLSNTSHYSLGEIAAAVSELFLGKKTTATPTATPAAGAVSLAPFAAYFGAYRDAKTGAGLQVYQTDSLLMSIPNGILVPVSAREATAGRARLKFNNTPRRLTMITADGDTILFAGVDKANLSATALQQYVGRYTSEETAAELAIVLKEGKPYLKIRDTEMPLTGMYKDGFSFPGGDLYFERKAGKIEKLFISSSRARNVVYQKKKS